MLNVATIIENYGYLGLFIIIYAESGILLGFFLPGDSLLFTAGFLASQGYLNIWLLTVFMFAAAFLGDSTGYYLGKKFGPRIFVRERSLLFNPEHVEKTRNFFEKYGNKTIVLARFMPVVRTFAPVMAGVGEMRYKQFATYNFIGALVWAVGITLLGFLFGNVIPNADKYVLPIILVIVFTSLIPPVISYLRERNKP